MHATQVVATMDDIAELTGLSIQTVRKHRREGWFDLGDFAGVVRYTQAQMVLKDLEPKEKRR